MKPSNQVHRNDATKRAPLQGKIPASDPAKADPFAPPKNTDDHPSCICIYDRDARKPVQIVPLTSAELVETLSLCMKPGCPQKTSGDVIAAAIREKLAGDQICKCLSEADDAANDIGHFLVRIEAGDLAPFIERLTDRLMLSIENAFHTLRGEPLRQ